MKIRTLLPLIFILSYQFVTAQKTKTTPHFLITGKVNNAQESSWRFAETSFLANKKIVVNIQKDGTFSQLVSVEGMQDLYLYLNKDTITIYVQPEDTIEVYWDENNFKKSFEIKSPKHSRNLDLQLNLKLHNEIKHATSAISKKLSKKKDEENSLKWKWINDQFNQHLKAVLDDDENFTETTPKFVNQIYFFYAKLLFSNRLIDKYTLIPDNAILNPNNLPLLKYYIPSPSIYMVLDDATFYQCPEYRDFLFDYVRFANPLFSGTSPMPSVISTSANGDTLEYTPPYLNTKFYNKKNEVLTRSFVLDYYKGLSHINLSSIRDWYITKVILLAYDLYAFDEAESLAMDFLPKCKSTPYRDSLVSCHSYFKKFKAGRLAPEFTLKDQNGKSVSLSDFKGKIVYLDFWSVTCGPCRYEFENYFPKLHEKYKDQGIVFVNICLCSDKDSWKKALSEFKLNGVNLFAEGGTNNKVYKDYNIIGFPRYMLIDKYGKFINNNAPRPAALIDPIENIIDKLLMTK